MRRKAKPVRTGDRHLDKSTGVRIDPTLKKQAKIQPGRRAGLYCAQSWSRAAALRDLRRSAQALGAQALPASGGRRSIHAHARVVAARPYC